MRFDRSQQRRRLGVLLGSLLLATGASCGKGASPDAAENPEGPSGDTAPPTGTSGDSGGFQPVHFDGLVALVPPKAGPWELQDATGQMLDVVGGQHAHVRAYYTRPGENARVHVQLLDGGGDPTVVSVFQTMVDTEQAGISAGYEQLQVNGHPAVQAYLASPVNTTLHVLIEGRYMLILSGEGLEPPQVRQVATAFDLEAVAALE